MPINAKIVDAAGEVKTIKLPDNPSDEDLIRALGAKGYLVAHRAWAGGYEVLGTIDGNGATLIVGLPPHMNGPPTLRTSCNLTDDQAKGLVKLVTSGWPPPS